MRSSRLATSLAFLLLIGITVAVEASWDKGLQALRANDLEKALREFREVAAKQPDWPGGHFMVGQVLLKQGMAQAAAEALQRAILLDPGNHTYQFILAQAYFKTARYGDAALLLQKLNPSSLPVDQRGTYHLILAVALDKSGQGGVAVEELRKAAEAKPTDAGVWHSYAKGLLGQARQESGAAKAYSYSKAAESAKRAAALDSSYANLMILAESQLGTKDYSGALATLEVIVASSPSDWLPYFYQAMAYAVQFDLPKAEAAARTALESAPTEEDKKQVWRQLGFIAEKSKRFDEAIAAYQNAGDEGGAARAADSKRLTLANQDPAESEREIAALNAELQRLEGLQDQYIEKLESERKRVLAEMADSRKADPESAEVSESETLAQRALAREAAEAKLVAETATEGPEGQALARESARLWRAALDRGLEPGSEAGRKFIEAERDCLKRVFGRYCLGETVDSLPEPAARAADGSVFTFKDGEEETTTVLIVDGRVARVLRSYQPGSWLVYRRLEESLCEKYGPGVDTSVFPTHTDDDDSRAVVVRLGEARASRVWAQQGWTVALQWEGKDVVLIYHHDELSRIHNDKVMEQF